MALWTGLVPLSAVASFRRRETSLGNCDDVRLVEAPAVALTFKNPRGQSRLPCADGAVRRMGTVKLTVLETAASALGVGVGS